MSANVLGVIGGLGPLATAAFLERVTQMTAADTEQGHLDMIVYSFPSIPDRTGYLLGASREYPLPGLLRCAKALERQGVHSIVMPCITAHAFLRELQAGVNVPVIDAIAETAAVLNSVGIRRVGVLATDGTLHSGILTHGLEKAGITPILPGRQGQQDVMHLIYNDLKAGNPVDHRRFQAVRQELLHRGSQVLLLGCTELSLLRLELNHEEPFLDMMDVMAQAAILQCGKQPKPQALLKGVCQNADQYSGISGTDRRPCAGTDRHIRRA